MWASVGQVGGATPFGGLWVAAPGPRRCWGAGRWGRNVGAGAPLRGGNRQVMRRLHGIDGPAYDAVQQRPGRSDTAEKRADTLAR